MMALFTILDSILAGIFGTLLMTLFIRFIGAVTGNPFSVPRILGTLLTFNRDHSARVSRRFPVFLAGAAAHYLIGILFTLLYAWLAVSGMLLPGYRSGLLFGVGVGVLGVGIWYLAFRLHPRPPVLDVRLFLVAIFAGHLLFAMGIVAVFNLLLTMF